MIESSRRTLGVIASADDEPDRHQAAVNLRWRKVAGRQSRAGLSDSVSFSPDGAAVALHGAHGFQMVDVGSGEQRYLGRSPLVKLTARSPVFSSDGRCVAAAAAQGTDGEEVAWVWDRRTGEELHSITAGSHEVGVDAELLFSPMGRYFAVPAFANMVWDTRFWLDVWDQVVEIGHPAAFGAGDGWLAVAQDDMVSFRELPDPAGRFDSRHGGTEPITGLQAHPVDKEVLLSVATPACACIVDLLGWNGRSRCAGIGSEFLPDSAHRAVHRGDGPVETVELSLSFRRVYR